MTTEPDSIVLRFLRRLDEKIDRIAEDTADLKRGQIDLARQVAALRRDQAGDAESVIHVSERLDRFDRRLTRVERRLEIAEDQPPAD